MGQRRILLPLPLPSEYAVANHVQHPLCVTVRQDAVLDPLDTWLASKFGPRYLPATIDDLAAATIGTQAHPGQDHQ